MRWYRRTLSREDRKSYDRQARSVASKVRQWKLAAEESGKAPSREDLTEARMTAWERPRISAMIEEEMRTSASLFHEIEYDENVESRVRRISLALSLLDLLDRMRKSAVSSGNSTAVMGVTALCDELRWLLDDTFFLLDERSITSGYLDVQPTLIACGALTDVQVPGLERMLTEHTRAVALRIGELAVELDIASPCGILD